jgi:hypothetical protein
MSHPDSRVSDEPLASLVGATDIAGGRQPMGSDTLAPNTDPPMLMACSKHA